MEYRLSDLAGRQPGDARIGHPAVGPLLVREPSARPLYAELLDERFNALTDQQRTVLTRRYCDPELATLNAVGAEFGVTRERIRQIESSALDLLGGKTAPGVGGHRTNVAPSEGGETYQPAEPDSVRQAVDRLHELELPITGSALVEAGFEQHDRTTTALLFAVAKRMGVFGGRKIDAVEYGGRLWLTSGDRTPKRLLEGLIEGACPLGVVSDLVGFWAGMEDRLRPHVGSPGEAEEVASDVLESLALTEINGQFAVLAGVGVAEGLVRILRANESPMKRDVLLPYFTSQSSRHVTNALLDPRIVRVGSAEFGLKEFGAQARPTLRDLVYREIDRYGQVAVSYLQDLAAQYEYSRASIGFYASLPDVIEDAGVLRRRRPDDPPAVRQPGLDGACFRVVAGPNEGCWACTIVIDHRRLYQSSLSIPTPLAELLEMEPGSRGLSIAVGAEEVHASWMHSAYLFGGELRQLFDKMGLANGQAVRFIVTAPGHLEVEPLPDEPSINTAYSTLVSGACLYDAAGDPFTDPDFLPALASSVGLPGGAPLPIIEQRLRDRRNGSLREALLVMYPELSGQ